MRNCGDTEYTEIDVENITETASAVLFDDGDHQCWVPKSVLGEWPAIGESGTASVEMWFAEKEGLV